MKATLRWHKASRVDDDDGENSQQQQQQQQDWNSEEHKEGYTQLTGLCYAGAGATRVCRYVVEASLVHFRKYKPTSEFLKTELSERKKGIYNVITSSNKGTPFPMYIHIYVQEEKEENALQLQLQLSAG